MGMNSILPLLFVKSSDLEDTTTPTSISLIPPPPPGLNHIIIPYLSSDILKRFRDIDPFSS